jgi:hypothetical protein
LTVEEADELLKRMITLCADVEVAKSVGWCSRAKNAVVDVKSGWPVSRKSPWTAKSDGGDLRRRRRRLG